MISLFDLFYLDRFRSHFALANFKTITTLALLWAGEY